MRQYTWHDNMKYIRKETCGKLNKKTYEYENI